MKKISRRLQLSRGAFAKLSYILRHDIIRITLKRNVYDICILPVFTYGLKTVAFAQINANKLRVIQRAMERAMLGVFLKGKIRYEEIRRRTKAKEIMKIIAELK